MAYQVEELGEKGAEPLMRWLISAAHARSTISYGRIAALLEEFLGIEKIFSIHIGHVAGRMQDRILKTYPRAPLLNALVVDARGLPGGGIDGYLADRFGGTERRYKNPDVKRKVCEQAQHEVYSSKNWEGLYRRTFHRRYEDDPIAIVNPSERDGKSPDGRHGGGAESPEHKRLKVYVKDHPHVIGLRLLRPKRENEKRLLSGDEVDVYFEDERHAVLVEVKSKISDYPDFQRGIYQCVKYRAVMQAQTPDHSGIRVFLVTERELPHDLRALAKRLDIGMRIVRVN